MTDGTIDALPAKRNGEDYTGAMSLLLPNGHHTLIDADRFAQALTVNWRAYPRGNYCQIQAKVAGKTISLSRYLMKAPPHLFVDHINGDQRDNRHANLRLATPAENSRNRKKHINSSSRFKGVYWSKHCRKWRASVRVDYGLIDLGLFENEIDAALAYNEAAARLFGSFARINTV